MTRTGRATPVPPFPRPPGRTPSELAKDSLHGPVGTAEGVPEAPVHAEHRPPGDAVRALPVTSGDTPRVLGPTGSGPVPGTARATGGHQGNNGLPSRERGAAAGPDSPAAPTSPTVSAGVHTAPPGGPRARRAGATPVPAAPAATSGDLRMPVPPAPAASTSSTAGPAATLSTAAGPAHPTHSASPPVPTRPA
ncbi:hypothetical protein [Actinomadura oligospora]|uniref:hypothetical protein n=1 Tax=Actinomadura oligospora TaxID=111804 RepID=UPI00047D72A9|nr:hypothetical protein [Actinomadura oligospora]